jgi:hypothetical protein
MNLKNHLLTFLKLEAQFKLSYNALTSHIASSLLMNTYSSDMHHESLTDSFLWCFSWMFVHWLCVQSLTLCSKFDSVTVFQTLYKSLCSGSSDVLWLSIFCELSVSVHWKPPERHVHSYEPSLQQLSTVTSRQPQGSKDELNTSENQHYLLVLSAAKSKHVLMWSCCLWYLCSDFWASLVSFSIISIHTCMLCQSESLTTWLKPPTAKYWVLSVNREEPQGIISLKFMKLIQDLVCECSVEDLLMTSEASAWYRILSHNKLLSQLIHTTRRPYCVKSVSSDWDASCIQEFDMLIKQFC